MKSTAPKLLVVTLLVAAAAVLANAAEIETITAEQLHQRLQSKETPLVVDVREVSEWDAGHIAGATLIPLGSVKDKLTTLPKDREIVLVCRSGRRSGKAYEILAENGFKSLKNMQGGMLAWEKLGYPVAKK